MSRRAVAVTIAVLCVSLVAACDLLVLVHHLRHWPHGYSYWLEGSVSEPVWIVVGLLIMLRVPGNRLGWVAIGVAIGSGVQLAAGALATQLAGTGPTTSVIDWLAALSATGQICIVGGLIIFAMLAPDGRLSSPGWRPFFVATIVALGIVAINQATTDSGVQNLVVVAQAPVGPLPKAWSSGLMLVANITVFVGVAAAFVSLVLRFRRGTLVTRQQLKWLLYAATVALALIVIAQPLADHLWPGASLPGSLIWAAIGSCLPAGIAIGVLRYRLYDIDRIVSRTLSYALVSGAVVGVYVAVIALVDDVLGFSSSVAVAASTLTAAAAFQPLRVRLQRGIDRRFDRAAYDARRTVEAFAARLRDEVDVDTVRHNLLATVTDVVAPSAASVWIAS